MRKAYHPRIRFHLGKVDGCFGKNGWLNRHCIVLNKKTDALTTANQILQAEGQVYIKVTYGKHLDNWGENTLFYNDGIYNSTKDLKEALSAFTEHSLINYILGDEK